LSLPRHSDARCSFRKSLFFDGEECVLMEYQELFLLMPRPEESIAICFFLGLPRFF
jgi:hypothetical protein